MYGIFNIFKFVFLYLLVAMFWMQQKESTGDEENVKKVNELLNLVVAPPANNAQNQWMQMLG